MKYLLYSFALLLSVFFACKQDAPNGANAPYANMTKLQGNWIALDFCSRANQYGSVLQAMNVADKPFAYAVRFDTTKVDSAICHNGKTRWVVPIKIRKDTIELVGAVQGKSVFMVYNSQSPEKDINMFDATGGRVKLERFVKSKGETPNPGMAFAMALNHNLLGGGFSNKGAKVFFQTTGEVQGLDKFLRYDICEGGDCFVAGQEIDVVTLYKSREEFTQFGYRYNKSNDTLRLYNLIRPSDSTAVAKVGAVAYTLVKLPQKQ